MNRQQLDAEVRNLRQRLIAISRKEALESELIDLVRAAKALGHDGTGRYPDIYNEVHQALDDLHSEYFPAKCELHPP